MTWTNVNFYKTLAFILWHHFWSFLMFSGTFMIFLALLCSLAQSDILVCCSYSVHSHCSLLSLRDCSALSFYIQSLLSSSLIFSLIPTISFKQGIKSLEQDTLVSGSVYLVFRVVWEHKLSLFILCATFSCLWLDPAPCSCLPMPPSPGLAIWLTWLLFFLLFFLLPFLSCLASVYL